MSELFYSRSMYLIGRVCPLYVHCSFAKTSRQCPFMAQYAGCQTAGVQGEDTAESAPSPPPKGGTANSAQPCGLQHAPHPALANALHCTGPAVISGDIPQAPTTAAEDGDTVASPHGSTATSVSPGVKAAACSRSATQLFGDDAPVPAQAPPMPLPRVCFWSPNSALP